MVTKLNSEINNFTNIFHISDIHIRLTKRHDEYLEVFNRLYKLIEKTPNETVVCILGDLFHNKSDLSPECVDIASTFLKNIADRRITVLVAGNHDATLTNKNRMDSLTPIVNAIRRDNLFYLKDTGVYILGDILFNNYSVFDEYTPEKYIKFADIPKTYVRNANHFVALFHGGINNAITDLGFKVNKSISNELFDGHHIVLLGDIHRHQVLQQYDANEDKPAMVYASSLIQQNHGEDLNGHGFVFWDLKTKKFKHYELSNDYGFFTVEINKGKLITDLNDIPKKAILRIKCFESVASEIETILSGIKLNAEVVDISYIRADNASHAINVSNLNLHDITNIDYQNKIITEYIKEKYPDVLNNTLNEIIKINAELNDKLDKNVIVRNIRWKPKKFEFDNMFSYGENNVIDFTKMHDVIGLFASNAAGKSSLLSALSFCIFDKCDRAFKASHVLNTQKISFKCKFNFEINKVDYFIERKGSSDKKGNVKVDVKFWKEENGTVVELNGEARRSTNDIIRDYVGSYDDFILTTLSIQNNKSGTFIDMGQTERKDLLAQFLGLTVFDKLYNLSSEKTKETAVLLKNFNKTDYISNITKFSDNISRTELVISEQTRSLDQLISDREKFNNKLIDETKKLINIDSDVTDITLLETELLACNNNVCKCYDNINNIKLAVKQLESNKDILTNEILKYEQNNINEKYKELNDLNIKCNNIKQQLEKKKIVVNSKLQKLKTLEEHKYDPNCEYCINNIFVKDAIKTKEELENDKIEIKNIIDVYNNLKNKISTLSYISDDYENYQSNLKDESVFSSKIASANNTILKLENEISNGKNNLEKLSAKRKEFYDKKDAIESNKISYELINSFKIEIKNLDFQIKSINNNLIDLKSKVNTWISQKDNLQDTIEKNKILENQNKAYQIYTDAVSRDGIQYKIISQALPEIEKEVNDILSQMVEFKVSFQTDGKNVSTFILYDDKKWPLELSSGLEKFISSLAIRVALINISNLPRPSFIAIDEGFGVMDSSNLSSVGALFEFLKTNFDFILIISHLDIMRDMVNSHLEIQKENGFSKINFQ